MAKDTHVTKDGRTVKKGLYYYMNQRKKKGTSRKGKGTVTDAALKRSAKTCLLYTSPSPRDRQKSRMPSSA